MRFVPEESLTAPQKVDSQPADKMTKGMHVLIILIEYVPLLRTVFSAIIYFNPHDSPESIYKSFNEFLKAAKFISSFDKDDFYYDFYYATDNKEIQNSLKVED